MNAIASTTTRPARDGRLILEVQVEGGALHVFEVDGAKFYSTLKPILQAPDTKRIGDAPPNESLPSSFDPQGNPS